MYLTGRETALVSAIFTVLADSLPEQLMRQEVGLRLLELLRADFFGSYAWDDTKKKFVNRVAINISDTNLSDYEQYYQYRDTVTPRLQRCRRAVRVSDVIPQSELERTELFNDFLRRDGLHWGLNVYAWSGESNIGDLRVWRSKRRDDFSDHELALVELIRQAFTTALARARADAGMVKPAEPLAQTLADDVLRHLTAREREVVGLVGEGLLDKEIAYRLGISYTTVRTHLDRSFKKLGVSNRSKLVRLMQAHSR